MSEQQAPATPAVQRSAFEEKWGAPLIAAGYGCVPNVIVQRHTQLGMSPTELALYLVLASFWWRKGEKPFPSILELSKAMGMNPRNVQRRLRKMEAVGFIRIGKRRTKYGGNKSNEYDLMPLIKAANKLALEEVARRKKSGLAKLGRKAVPAVAAPALKVVKT